MSRPASGALSGPLSGLRVIEMAGIGPCPFAAMMLADHGAEVIRLHPLAAASDVPGLGGAADVLARGRRSLALDLKSPAGVALALDLVAQADGLIEGFRPGVMERLGLGPDACLARNPRLAYGRMTGWGQNGPLATRAGHDLNYIGLTGALHAMGAADAPPPVPLNLLGDFGGGGMMLAFGMLAAILSARATGRGQVVDAAMTDGTAALSAMIWGFRAAGIWGEARAANLLDGGAWFYGCYACRDGRYLAVAPIEDKFRRAFLDRLGPEGAALAEGADAPQDWPAKRAALAAVLATRDRDDWVARFAGSDACVTPVLDWTEALAHPHNTARSTFATHEGMTQPAPAPRFSATPSDLSLPPQLPGANSHAVLADWGVDAARRAALVQAGVIPAE